MYAGGDCGRNGHDLIFGSLTNGRDSGLVLIRFLRYYTTEARDRLRRSGEARRGAAGGERFARGNVYGNVCGNARSLGRFAFAARERRAAAVSSRLFSHFPGNFLTASTSSETIRP